MEDMEEWEEDIVVWEDTEDMVVDMEEWVWEWAWEWEWEWVMVWEVMVSEYI